MEPNTAQGGDNGGRNDDKPPHAKTDFKSVPVAEQLRLRAMRHQVATTLRLCLGQCRIALKYYMLGLTNAPSESDDVTNTNLLKALNERMDALEGTIAPFATDLYRAPDFSGTQQQQQRQQQETIHLSSGDNKAQQQEQQGQQGQNLPFDPSALNRLDYVRDKLMAAGIDGVIPIHGGYRRPQPTSRVREVIASVIDEMEKDARVARMVPPRYVSDPSQSYYGGEGHAENTVATSELWKWRWSWNHDDWFELNMRTNLWVSASRKGLELDNLI